MNEDPTGPQAMRAAVRDYVWTLHRTYLDHVRHLAPGERATLPLVAAGELTIAAVAARRLHLLATTEALPPPTGAEVAIADEHGGIRWTVRFFDATIIPALGTIPDEHADDVRRALGVVDTVYHLTIGDGGGLTDHHAQHSGVALANQHATMVRDLDRLRHALPRQQQLVEELAACVRLGLDRAAALLVSDLTAGRVVPPCGTPAAACLGAALAETAPR